MKEEMPEVSILTAIGPRSGHQRFLEEAYESLLASSLTDWEWCLQVDSGPDGQSTRDIRYLEKIAEEDTRLALGYNAAHFGVSVTRNLAFLRAKSDIVQSLDADDMILPESMQKMSEVLLSDPELGYVFGEAIFLHDGRLEDKEEAQGSLGISPGRHEAGALPEAWIEAREIPFQPEGVMWRKNTALLYGGYAALPSGGDETLALAVAHDFPVFYLPENTFYKRVHLESTSKWQAGQETRQADGTKALLTLHRLGRL